jgi:hypothetical protein
MVKTRKIRRMKNSRRRRHTKKTGGVKLRRFVPNFLKRDDTLLEQDKEILEEMNKSETLTAETKEKIDNIQNNIDVNNNIIRVLETQIDEIKNDIDKLNKETLKTDNENDEETKNNLDDDAKSKKYKLEELLNEKINEKSKLTEVITKSKGEQIKARQEDPNILILNNEREEVNDEMKKRESVPPTNRQLTKPLIGQEYRKIFTECKKSDFLTRKFKRGPCHELSKTKEYYLDGENSNILIFNLELDIADHLSEENNRPHLSPKIKEALMRILKALISKYYVLTSENKQIVKKYGKVTGGKHDIDILSEAVMMKPKAVMMKPTGSKHDITMLSETTNVKPHMSMYLGTPEKIIESNEEYDKDKFVSHPAYDYLTQEQIFNLLNIMYQILGLYEGILLEYLPGLHGRVKTLHRYYNYYKYRKQLKWVRESPKPSDVILFKDLHNINKKIGEDCDPYCQYILLFYLADVPDDNIPEILSEIKSKSKNKLYKIQQIITGHKKAEYKETENTNLKLFQEEDNKNPEEENTHKNQEEENTHDTFFNKPITLLHDSNDLDKEEIKYDDEEQEQEQEKGEEREKERKIYSDEELLNYINQVNAFAKTEGKKPCIGEPYVTKFKVEKEICSNPKTSWFKRFGPTCRKIKNIDLCSPTSGGNRKTKRAKRNKKTKRRRTRGRR